MIFSKMTKVAISKFTTLTAVTALLALSITACSTKNKAAETTAVKETTAKSESTTKEVVPANEQVSSKKITTKSTKVKASKETTDSSTTADTAKPSTTSATGSLTCKSGEDNRSVEIKDAGQGCEVVYTKFNEAKTIATAANDKSFCETVSDKVKKNLEASGFSCE